MLAHSCVGQDATQAYKNASDREMLPEALYVTLMEYIIFLLVAGGLLQIHSEKNCSVYDEAELECLVAGSTYYAVMYGVFLLASAVAVALLASAVAHSALLPGTRVEFVKHVALAGFQWQIVISMTLLATLLAVWERPGHERRLFWAVLVRTSVSHVESEILTRLYILCSWLFAFLFTGFSSVLYVVLARLAPAGSVNIHSLTLSALLLVMFIQHWLAAYKARVCENVNERQCPPALSSLRTAWFVQDYEVAYTACLCLSFVALCDLAGMKARSFYERKRENKKKYVIFFTMSRAALDGVLGFTVMWVQTPEILTLYWYALGLWLLCVASTVYDCYQFNLLQDTGPRVLRPSIPFDITSTKKRILVLSSDYSKKVK